MDDYTRRELLKIEERMPEHLKRGLMKTVIDSSQQERAKEVLRSRFVPDSEKEKIRELMGKGAFKPRVEKVVDETVAKQIDRYHDVEVKRAIREGRVTDPSKVDDPWITKRNKKYGNKKSR